MKEGDKWNGWLVESKIGEGHFGQVFKIVRSEYGYVESALKVMRVPKDEAELSVARNMGLEGESLDTYFESIVADLVSEFTFMSELRGNSNIVSYEDHEVYKHPDEPVWDIFIRMELLVPLNKKIKNEPLSVEEVVKLGKDICKGLILCQSKHIIHRDIKPDNIFYAKSGNYKLGDFGIARETAATAAMTKVGTISYMAPEVAKGLPYNQTVDIYSLGIVLYRFLNNNRLPFLPPAPQPIVNSDIVNANKMRMNGALMEPPCLANDELSEIVLKACAFDSADRYQSAREMLKALENVDLYAADSNVKDKEIEESSASDYESEQLDDLLEKEEETVPEPVFEEETAPTDFEEPFIGENDLKIATSEVPDESDAKDEEHEESEQVKVVTIIDDSATSYNEEVNLDKQPDVEVETVPEPEFVEETETIDYQEPFIDENTMEMDDSEQETELTSSEILDASLTERNEHVSGKENEEKKRKSKSEKQTKKMPIRKKIFIFFGVLMLFLLTVAGLVFYMTDYYLEYITPKYEVGKISKEDKKTYNFTGSWGYDEAKTKKLKFGNVTANVPTNWRRYILDMSNLGFDTEGRFASIKDKDGNRIAWFKIECLGEFDSIEKMLESDRGRALISIGETTTIEGCDEARAIDIYTNNDGETVKCIFVIVDGKAYWIGGAATEGNFSITNFTKMIDSCEFSSDARDVEEPSSQDAADNSLGWTYTKKSSKQISYGAVTSFVPKDWDVEDIEEEGLYKGVYASLDNKKVFLKIESWGEFDSLKKFLNKLDKNGYHAYGKQDKLDDNDVVRVDDYISSKGNYVMAVNIYYEGKGYRIAGGGLEDCINKETLEKMMYDSKLK